MKRVLLKLALLVFVSASFLFVLGSLSLLRAQEELPKDIPSEEITEISSFELFWPIVAGKTIDDPLYFLKNLKETIRGWLIFGKPQKTEYAVFLATKRVVEAEKLINKSKFDLADRTLDRAISQLKVAERNVGKMDGFLEDVVNQINNKLDNLEKFIPWLASQNEEMKDKLQSILEKVKLLNQKV